MGLPNARPCLGQCALLSLCVSGGLFNQCQPYIGKRKIIRMERFIRQFQLLEQPNLEHHGLARDRCLNA